MTAATTSTAATAAEVLLHGRYYLYILRLFNRVDCYVQMQLLWQNVQGQGIFQVDKKMREEIMNLIPIQLEIKHFTRILVSKVYFKGRQSPAGSAIDKRKEMFFG